MWQHYVQGQAPSDIFVEDSGDVQPPMEKKQ